MTPMSRVALAAALLALAGCGAADGVTDPTLPIDPLIPTEPTQPTTPSAPAAAVSITPRQTTLLPATGARLSATVTDAAGGLLPDASVTWVSLDATTVSASAGGRVNALRAGLARIVAISGAARDTAIVKVAITPPPPVGRVAVSPAVLALTPGTGQQIAALVRDDDGTPVTDRPLTWQSSAPGVATVTSNGYVRAVANGFAFVVVSVGDVVDTVRVTVGARAPDGGAPPVVTTVSVAPAAMDLDVGETQAIAASAFDAGGRVVTGRTVTWESEDAGVASVSPTGVVRAVAVGSTRIRATIDGVWEVVTVRVTPPAPVPTTIRLSSTSATLNAGGTFEVSATVLDQTGAPMSGYNFAWSSAAASIATVSAGGRITAVGSGTTTVTATAAGLSAKLSVTVTGGTATNGLVTLTTTNYGSVALSAGETVLLPSVLVAGDDDAAGLSALQAIVIFSLADVPAGATISTARLDVAIDTEATFGQPYTLGGLYAERTTTIDVATAAPGANALLLASEPTAAITAELTTLVQAAIAAGDDYVAVRFRLPKASNGDGQTDQLELTIGSLAVSWAR